MKVKAVSRDRFSKKKFFLLMIVPYLIGIFIFLNSFAFAAWGSSEDPNINHRPTDQGWTVMKYEVLKPIPLEPAVSLAER